MVTRCFPSSTTGKEYTEKSLEGVKVQVFLLFNEKQSFRKLGDIIYQQSKSGEIYVRRDALTVIFDNNRILYGNLVTYGGNGLRRLWELVFSEGSTLLGKGLVALGLQNAAIIWLNNKPKQLGNIIGRLSRWGATYAQGIRWHWLLIFTLYYWSVLILC